MVLKPWKLVISELWGFETLQIWPVQLKWEGIIKRDPQHVDVEIIEFRYKHWKRDRPRILLPIETVRGQKSFLDNHTEGRWKVPFEHHPAYPSKEKKHELPKTISKWCLKSWGKKKGVTSPHASPSWRGGPRWWCGKSTHASATNDSGHVDIAVKMGRSAVGCNYHFQCSSISSISNRRIIY